MLNEWLAAKLLFQRDQCLGDDQALHAAAVYGQREMLARGCHDHPAMLLSVR
jgi:hypothetical protein